MNPARNVVVSSVLALVGLVGLLLWKPTPPTRTQPVQPLLVYCAAGMKGPVEAIAHQYQQLFGIPVQIQFGGSGTLLSNLRVAKTGDLFLAADDSFLDLARSNQLIAETIPIARMVPVLAIRKDHPNKPRSLQDLQRGSWKLAMANPEAAAVGKVCRSALVAAQLWDALQPHVKVFKPTVNDIASDIKLGTVDAGFIWDSTVTQYPELEAIHVPELDRSISTVSIAVLNSCQQPTAALRFARFLSARDQGLPQFERAGFTVVRGDVWAETPEVILFSGGVNRTAIEPTVRKFEVREGAKVSRVYNGCGILTAQIRSGQRPDAYFACDVSFMRNVSEHFGPANEISETPIVILVRKGNPRGIRDLAGLAAPGLGIGVANEQQSALGAMTAQLLRKQGLLDKVMANVRVQTPTADLLVNQIRTGSLDAVVVFKANTVAVRDLLDVVDLDGPGTLAIQPFAVGLNSSQAHLMERLLAMLRSANSRQLFEESGFRWRETEPRP